MLEDKDADVRLMTVMTLGKLKASELATHAAALVAKLEDEDARVRMATVQTLGKPKAAGMLSTEQQAKLVAAAQK